MDSDSDLDHFFTGALLESIDQAEEALGEYQKASLLCPGDARYHFCTAKTLVELERNEEALDSVQEAIRCDPEYYQAYELMSSILHKLGHISEADKAQKKAKELREAKGAGKAV